MGYAVSVAATLIQNIPKHNSTLLQGLESYNFAEEYLASKGDENQLLEITNIVKSLPFQTVGHNFEKNGPGSLTEQFVKSFGKEGN